MEKYSVKYSIPFLGTIIYRRRNPIIAAITDREVIFEVSVSKLSGEKNIFKINGVTFEKILKHFLNEYLQGIGEVGVNVEINVLLNPGLIEISTYASLSGVLMRILGEKLGYSVDFDDIIRYSPLLECEETLNYLPIIMALRVSSLQGLSIIYRLSEGYVKLPSKTPIDIYVVAVEFPLTSRNIEYSEFKDYFVHLEGRNVIEAARAIQENKVPYENIVFEEAIQHVFYRLEDEIDLNIYYRGKCIAFPDLNYKTVLVCFKKPETEFKGKLKTFV